jgi:hypothetical protein
MQFYKIFFITFFFSISVSFGHVGLDYPKGGETFNAGDLINIEWYIAIDHGDCDWDLYFSADDGNTWSEIAIDIPKGQLKYEWTIPAIATEQGKVKVVQDNKITTSYDAMSRDFTINLATDITSENTEVKDFFINPAYPNPFNSTTIISFNLPVQDEVKLHIFNVVGEKIKTLINEEMSPGFHKVSWNADDVSSGVYFYTIETKNFLQTRKVILIK